MACRLNSRELAQTQIGRGKIPQTSHMATQAHTNCHPKKSSDGFATRSALSHLHQKHIRKSNGYRQGVPWCDSAHADGKGLFTNLWHGDVSARLRSNPHEPTRQTGPLHQPALSQPERLCSKVRPLHLSCGLGYGLCCSASQ